MMYKPSTRQIIIGSALAFAVHVGCFRSEDYTVDDAWIPARVARTLLHTGLPTYDATGPLTEATTSPLWLGLHVALLSLFPDLDPVPATRAVGALCGIVTVGLACALAAAAFPQERRAREAAWVTGAILAAHSGLAMHAVNGLESSAWWLACLMGVDMWRRQHGRGVIGIASLLIVLRPEGLLWGPLLVAGYAWKAQAWQAITLPLMVWGALLLGRVWIYGEALPNPAYAKPPDLHEGLRYVSTGLMWTGGWVLWVTARRAPGWALAATALTMAALCTGGDWMPGHRRLAEAQVLWAIAAGIAAAQGGVGRAAAALWFVLVGWQAISGQATARWYHAALADIGTRAANTPGITRIAAFDVGRIGWTFEGSIHDLAGLTDRRIGHAPGTHGQKPFDAALFDAERPELVVLTTTNDPSTGSPSFIRAEQAVYDHLATHDAYLFAGRRRVGSPDQALLFVHISVDLPVEVWSDWVQP